jgi:hypothetical protein
MAIKLNNGGQMIAQQPSVNTQTQPQATKAIETQQTSPTQQQTQSPPRPQFTPVRREQGNRKEMVHHPDHYGGKENPYEVIKVIRAWNLSFSLGNTVKYIARAGRKDPSKRIEDLHKAMWYLQEEINSEYERQAK